MLTSTRHLRQYSAMGMTFGQNLLDLRQENGMTLCSIAEGGVDFTCLARGRKFLASAVIEQIASQQKTKNSALP
jgi:hypothetical protein